jgi:hypothetical protein
MAHDHNGRVGPPRCEECNAPLNSDDPSALEDRLLDLNTGPSLCLDCHLERNPFLRIKKKRRPLGQLQRPSLAYVRREDKCQGASLLVP